MKMAYVVLIRGPPIHSRASIVHSVILISLILNVFCADINIRSERSKRHHHTLKDHSSAIRRTNDSRWSIELSSTGNRLKTEVTNTNIAPPLPSPASRVLQAECPSQFGDHDSLSSTSSPASPTTNSSNANLVQDCNCHSFEDGAYLDCAGARLASADLSQLIVWLQKVTVRSLSVNQLNQSDALWSNDDRLDRLFSRLLSVQQLQVTGSALDELDETSFSGLSDSLRSLSLTGGRLRKVRRNAMRQLRILSSLDLDANDLQQLQPYAFYAVPLQTLSVQSNRICSLHEHSFGGLEGTLQQLSLAQNCLTGWPLLALARLQRLKSLRLASNRIRRLQDSSMIESSLTTATISPVGVSAAATTGSHIRLMELEHLDLSDNLLDHLESGQLDGLPRLVSLALAGNRLSELSDDAFRSLDLLDTLDLARNRLRTLNLHAFRGLRSLRSLDLTANHLHELSPQTLQPLVALNELFLTGNSLQRLTNRTFQSCSQLTALFVSNNELADLEMDTFFGLHRLQQLHLSGNRIRAVSPILFVSCAESLRALALDGNLIAHLPPKLLHGHTHLHELRLQRNLLKRLPVNVLDSCEKLQELHLQSNRLEQIEPDSFRSLRSLQYLDAAGNRLQQLPGQLGGGTLRQLRLTGNQLYTLANLSLSKQPLLEALWLDQNRLSELSGRPFESLTSLQKLHLERNELQSIAPFAFSGLTNVLFLDLAQNGLRELHSDTFVGLDQLVELHLDGNHLLKLSAGVFKPLISLRKLHLQHNQLFSLENGAFAGLKHLQELNIRHSMLEQMPSTVLDELSELIMLDLTGNQLKLHDLSMRKLASLTELSIGGLNVTDHWFAEQGCHAKKVQLLNLNGAQLSPTSLQSLWRCLSNKRHLNLDSLSLNDSTVADLNRSLSTGATYEQMVELSLADNQLDSIPSQLIGRFGHLQDLQLSGNRFRRLFSLELPANHELRSLNLSRNSISVLDARCLANLTRLQSLDLSDNVIRFLPLSVFTELPDLQHLRLERNWLQFVPNAILKANLSSLRSLHFTGSPLTRIREDLGTEGVLSRLQSLHLDRTNLSVIASHDLLGLPALQTLILSRNQIQNISPGAFRALSELKRLDLSENRLRLLPTERLVGLTRLEHLNLSANSLSEMPTLHQQLTNLKHLDLSRNRLTRVESLGSIGESLIELRLASNMISWLDGRLFDNTSQLAILDLSRNHLSHLAGSLFTSIELSMQQLFITENPIHCDCGLLSFWEYLETHSRLVADQPTELICTQPDRLADVRVRSLQPSDFCPAPKLNSVELLEVASDFALIRWHVQNESLVGAMSLHVQSPSTRSWSAAVQLPASQRLHRLEQLEPNSEYTVCVQANGRYLQPLANPPTAYVLDRQRDHTHKLTTSNRKCIQIRTLEYQKRTPIQLSTFGLIVLAGSMAGLFLLCSIVLILGIRYRRSRLDAQSVPELKGHDLPELSDFPEFPEIPELPEEFITYRHFSLPSAENLYS